ncbi:MAG: putative transport system ATP-binding protein [Sphingomonadales bacterium]|jgi:putative ABC transport system ATP-binding protein|nr:putative transport system ATP-binding protein [Sphingomonadales bacterium]
MAQEARLLKRAAAGDGLFEKLGFDVEVSDIHKSYRIGEEVYEALKGVSCTIPRGKVTTIQGPSGCGKSTLLNMLSGVDHPDRGLVRVGTRDLTSTRSERELARYRLHEVGFVFQSFNLISGLTAFGNLLLPMVVAGWSREEQRRRGETLLELVGMAEKSEKRPDALSGGEQQRVAVALALVNDPALILADEPTGNLDTANAKNVTDLLWSLAHDFNKTVIITTHDPMVAERGDHIRHMRDGAFVA